VAIEGSLVGPALESQETPWLADHFHQRVDQATWFPGRFLGEGHEQRAEIIRLVLLDTISAIII